MADGQVKGWCPGALRPMESGDGLIVRVRPRAGAIGTGALGAVAAAARLYGSGLLDLTRRGNLQIRGVSIATLVPLLDVLGSEGLLDPTVAAEAVRNVLVSPLAGLDAEAAGDPRPIARALEARLVCDHALQALPGKFGFSVDGGGRLPLGVDAADVRILLATDGTARIALERSDGEATVAKVWSAEAAAAAARIAIALRPALGPARRRVRDLSDREIMERIEAPIGPPSRPAGRPATWLGLIANSGVPRAVGAAAPFGRLGAGELSAFCATLEAAGIDEVRLSPWRALYVPVADASAARAVEAAARTAGLRLDAGDPLLRIDACPGAPQCPSAQIATRPLAEAIAEQVRMSGLRSVHISGCGKGCARSAPADLTLLPDGHRLAVIVGGTVHATPARRIDPADLREAIDEACAHA